MKNSDETNMSDKEFVLSFINNLNETEVEYLDTPEKVKEWLEDDEQW